MLKKMIMVLACAIGMLCFADDIVLKAVEFNDYGGWTDQNGVLVSGKKGNVAKTTFEMTADKVGYVWVQTVSHGGKWRTSTFIMNGIELATLGDELNEGEKPGSHWFRCKRRAKIKQGENTIEVRANSDVSRIIKVVVSDNGETAPSISSAKEYDIYEDGKARGLEDVFGRPRPSPKHPGPLALSFGGGRPWFGNSLAEKLNAAGFNTQCVNGSYLNGEGGTFIRALPHASVEPKPLDGITWEFKNLNKYKLILFGGIPTENMAHIFTPERVATLKKYLEQGGCLMMTTQSPAASEELLPVILGPLNKAYETHDRVYATRPATENFKEFPEKWQLFNEYRTVQLKKDAKVISSIIDESGKEVGIYAAVWNYGKGKVLYLNTEHVRHNKTFQMANWAFGGPLFGNLAADLVGIKSDAVSKLRKPVETDPPIVMDSANIALEEPGWELTEGKGTPKLNANQTIFPNGTKLVMKENYRIDVYYPGQTKPWIIDVEPPKLRHSRKRAAVEDSSAEAVDVKEDSFDANISWKLGGIHAKSNLITFVWKGEDGSVAEQDFKTGTLKLDGVEYALVGERIRVIKSDMVIARLQMTNHLNNGKGMIRRFDCYQPPRGYAEYPTDGSKDIDSRPCGFFSSAQPFTYVEGADALYVGFVDEVDGVATQMTMKKGDANVLSEIRFGRGNKNAPVQTSFFWHACAKPIADNENGWLAMHQFQRHNLRVKFGFPEVPARPVGTYSNTASQKEKENTIKKMGEVGMTYCYMPYCPSQIKDMDCEKNLADFKLVKDNGMMAYPWHAAGHSLGEVTDGKNVDGWWARQPDGTIYTYFGGHYPVVDMSNQDFLDWYLPKLQRCIDAGVGTLWFDMGGTAGGTVNYSKPNSGTGLIPLLNVYKYLYDRGLCAVTEGMNPLGLNGYIYRIDKYTPMKGREYLLFSSMPENEMSGLPFDYFRSSMFDTFYSVAFDMYKTGFEHLPNQQKMLDKVAYYTPAVQRAIDSTGMPFIRKTEFGTTWIGPKGGALFFYNGVKNASIKLPKGMKPVSMTTPTETVEIKGKLPTNIPPETIIVLSK